MYWLTGVLGLALAVAPFLLRYSDHQMAMWTGVILGLVVLVASVFEALDESKAKWEWWVAGIAGLIAVLAPFVLGFSTMTAALWTMIILGIVVLAAAGYEVFFVQQPT
ncbi:MAG: SPW repeat protein [Caldilineaceae bacterium]